MFWFSVAKKKPPFEKPVLALAGGEIVMAFYCECYGGPHWHAADNNEEPRIYNVITHWRNLPRKPLFWHKDV
jgi:hypothetical protein